MLPTTSPFLIALLLAGCVDTETYRCDGTNSYMIGDRTIVIDGYRSLGYYYGVRARASNFPQREVLDCDASTTFPHTTVSCAQSLSWSAERYRPVFRVYLHHPHKLIRPARRTVERVAHTVIRRSAI